MRRLPLPRLERYATRSVLYDADDVGSPRSVGEAYQLSSRECYAYCALPGSWRYEGRVYYTRAEAEQSMMWARFGEDRTIPVEETTDDETD